MMRKLFLICFIFGFGLESVSYAQIVELDSVISYNKKGKALQLINSLFLSEYDENKVLNAEVLFLLSIKEFDSALATLKQIDTTRLSKLDMAFYNRSWGRIYAKSNFEDKAYELLIKSQKDFSKIGRQRLANRLSYDILYLLEAQDHFDIEQEDLLEDYASKSQSLNDSIALFNLNTYRAAVRFDSLSKDFFFKNMNQAKKIASHLGDPIRLDQYHQYVGLFYANYTAKEDSAVWHLDKSIELAKKYGTSNDLFYAYVNRAVMPRIQSNYKQSLTYMHMADDISINEYVFNNKRILYHYMASDYENMNKIDSALFYLNKYIAYTDSVDLLTQNRNLTLANTQEIQLEKQLETKKRMLNRSLLIASLLALLLFGVITLYYIKSLSRKRNLIAKENEILLKNQKLSSIDAMVAGQAQERQRIADDLHDNLGGLLATLKLYIENLKVKTNRLDTERDALLRKTDEILEMAYQKVRTLAHDRNSGNPISLGLLPAIKQYAARVTGSNKIVIEIHDQGQDRRIGNLAELTIFRILQELITNVIKHAFAKAVTIDFTYFEDDLSIVFEDDGVGFDPDNNVANADGMGLSSLKRRVDQLNGHLKIDSKPGYGTTVIINIPLV